jgi:hypothetical protein
MATYHGYLRDAQAMLKEAADGFMPEVMEVEVI